MVAQRELIDRLRVEVTKASGAGSLPRLGVGDCDQSLVRSSLRQLKVVWTGVIEDFIVAGALPSKSILAGSSSMFDLKQSYLISKMYIEGESKIRYQILGFCKYINIHHYHQK